MSPLEIILAIISVVSFGLAVFSFVRTEIKKATERAKVEVMREKLGNLHHGLGGLFHAVDAIVQVSKKPDVTVGELQNIARIIRGNILVLLEGIRRYRIKLEEWKFGLMIPSDKVEEIEVEAHKADEKIAEEPPADVD